MAAQITLDREECEAIHELIAELASDPSYVFAWDQTDTLTDVRTRALVKVYSCAGRKVPTFEGVRIRVIRMSTGAAETMDRATYGKYIEAGEELIVIGNEF